MKALAAVVIFSMLGSGAALATLTPNDHLHFVQAGYVADAPTTTTSARTTLESNYFQAPPEQPAVTQKIFPCRLEIFAKTRLAQTCN